jgi:hypothetical protein
MKQNHTAWLVFVFSLLVTSLACSLAKFSPLASSATATNLPSVDSNTVLVPTVEGYIDSNIYTSGIEVVQVIEVPGIVDHVANYALTFPKNWKVGPLHTDFASIVEKDSRVNENVKALFDYFLKTDPHIRAFGFSTAPTQLNKDSFLVAVVKVFDDEKYLSQTMDELADAFIANQPSGELVNFTYRSDPLTSATGVPTLIMLNEVQDGKGNIAIYNGILLAKLDSVYVQVFFLTNNPKIDLGEELAYPASSIMNYDK